MRIPSLILFLLLTGCATKPSPKVSLGGPTLYEKRMAIVTAKSSINLRGNGGLVTERKAQDGYVRAFTLAFPPVIPSSTDTFPPEAVNHYKVDNIIMDKHHVISCVTSFWSGK